MHDLLIAILPPFAIIFGLIAAYVLFDQSFNPRSKPSALSSNQLPITLESGGLLILPNALVILFGIGAFFYMIWVIGTAILHADRTLATIIVGCAGVLVWCVTRGVFIKLYDPTLITISSEGISYASYKSVRDWNWDQIESAEVRRVSASGGQSFSYACLCLKSDASQKSWAVRSGFVSDPDIVNLPAMLKSRFGVESAESVCELLNSTLARTARGSRTFGRAIRNT